MNAAHGVIGAPPPITLLYRSLAHDELAALFAVGQVCLITSLRDGMNLVSFEYVAAQEGAAATSRAGGGPGVLVLSEFTGASQCLAGALTVQPRDAADVAEKLACALGMGAEERRARHAASWAWVRVATAGAWAASFLCALRERAAAPPPPPPPPPRAEVAALWRRATRPAALLSASLLSFFSSEGHAAPAPAAAALASLLQRGARVALFSDGGAGALGTAFAAAPGALALVAEGGLEVRCAGGGAAGGAHALRGPLRPRLGGSAGAGDPGATQPAPHARAPSRHLQTVSQGSEEGAAVAAACDGAPPAWRCLLPADCLDPAWKPAVLAVLREAAGLACGSGVKETAYVSTRTTPAHQKPRPEKTNPNPNPAPPKPYQTQVRGGVFGGRRALGEVCVGGARGGGKAAGAAPHRARPLRGVALALRGGVARKGGAARRRGRGGSARRRLLRVLRGRGERHA